MPRAPAPPPGAHAGVVPPRRLKDLMSFRLNILVNLWTRLAAERNAQDFGLDLREWRILGLLGGYAPLSLKALAREAKLDKSQASRSVSALIERGFLRRDSDESDGRGVLLSLTPEGKALYRRVFPRAVKRNEELLAVLSPEERAILEAALSRLTAHAQQALASRRATGTSRGRSGSA